MIFVFTISAFFANNLAYGKETLIWMGADFPPIGIEQGPYKDQGMADRVWRILAEQMPNYNHQFRRANLKRILAELEMGNNVCVPGMIKTDEREKIMYFTRIPIMLLTPLSLVIRKEDRRLFG